MIISERLTLNGKEFDMLPKKIYLNYVNENDVGKNWSEEPISASDCEINNREYTDLSQVWHDASESPKINRFILVLLSDGRTIFWGTTPYTIYRYAWKYAIKWAYIDDLLPNR